MKDMAWCRAQTAKELGKELGRKARELDDSLKELQAARAEALQVRAPTARLLAAEKRQEAAQRQYFDARQEVVTLAARAAYAREVDDLLGSAASAAIFETAPSLWPLRTALDLADLYAAEIEEVLAKAGMPAKVGEAERYGLLRLFASGWTEFALRVVKGQTPSAWRARRGRTPEEASAPVVYRGRNGFVIADTSWRFDSDKTLDNAQNNA